MTQSASNQLYNPSWYYSPSTNTWGYGNNQVEAWNSPSQTFTPETASAPEGWATIPGLSYQTDPYGNLQATGTATQPIDFAGMSRDQWNAIYSPLALGAPNITDPNQLATYSAANEYGISQGWLEGPGMHSDDWRNLALVTAAVAGGALAAPSLFGTSAVGPAAGAGAGMGTTFGMAAPATTAAMGGAAAAPMTTGINMGGMGTTAVPASTAAGSAGMWSPGVTAGTSSGMFGSMPGITSGGYGTAGPSIMSNPLQWAFTPVGGSPATGGATNTIMGGTSPFNLAYGIYSADKMAGQMEDAMNYQNPYNQYALAELQKLDSNPEAYLNSPEVVAARNAAMNDVARQAAAAGNATNLEEVVAQASIEFNMNAINMRRQQLIGTAGAGIQPNPAFAGPMQSAQAQRYVGIGSGVSMFANWALNPQTSGNTWVIK